MHKMIHTQKTLLQKTSESYPVIRDLRDKHYYEITVPLAFHKSHILKMITNTTTDFKLASYGIYNGWVKQSVY